MSREKKQEIKEMREHVTMLWDYAENLSIAAGKSFQDRVGEWQDLEGESIMERAARTYLGSIKKGMELGRRLRRDAVREGLVF